MHITHCGSASHGRGNASWPSVPSRQPAAPPGDALQRQAETRAVMTRTVSSGRSRRARAGRRRSGGAWAARLRQRQRQRRHTAAPAAAPGEAAPRKALASRDDGATSRASSPMNTLLREISRNLSVRFRKDETVEDGALDRRRQASSRTSPRGGSVHCPGDAEGKVQRGGVGGGSWPTSESKVQEGDYQLRGGGGGSSK